MKRGLESEVSQKRENLIFQVDQLKEVSLGIQELLDQDKARLKKIAYAYANSGSLLQRTMSSLDRVLSQGDVQLILLFSGCFVFLFLLVWKFMM